MIIVINRIILILITPVIWSQPSLQERHGRRDLYARSDYGREASASGDGHGKTW